MADKRFRLAMTLAVGLACLAGSIAQAKAGKNRGCKLPRITSFTVAPTDRLSYIDESWTVEFTLKGVSVVDGWLSIYGNSVASTLYVGSVGGEFDVSFTAGLPSWREGPRQEHAYLTNSCGSTRATLSFNWRRHAASTDPDRRTTYVAALGDSYSSGEGNPPYLASGGTCHRGLDAWPFQLQEVNLHVLLVGNLACSGARIGDLFRPFKGQPAQIEALKQLRPLPTVVTVTIGGNDIDFGKVLLDCVVWDCVSDHRLDRAMADIGNLGGRLTAAFKRIRQAVPAAELYVVGYPRLFPVLLRDTRGCGWLEPQELYRLNALAWQLDNVERTAADEAGATYITSINGLAGNELCTHDPHVIPLSKACVVNPAPCGHPTFYGQWSLAEWMYDGH